MPRETPTSLKQKQKNIEEVILNEIMRDDIVKYISPIAKVRETHDDLDASDVSAVQNH